MKVRLDLEALFVADSALYDAEHLPGLDRLRWLCRVPGAIKEAKRLLTETPQKAFVESALLKGYRIAEAKSDYSGVSQRWLVVESEARRQAEKGQLEKRLERVDREASKGLTRLKRQTFSCEADAHKAAEAFAKDLKHHRLTDLGIIALSKYGKPGRPAKGSEPRRFYRIEATLERDAAAIDEVRRRAGRFILATNVLDHEISADELLVEYKDQHSVERGFRFLKDPLFFTSSVFVKSPRRVAAIAMGHGAMPFGLRVRRKGVASGLRGGRSFDPPPDGQAHRSADAAVGVPAFSGFAPAERGWHEADRQPHRGAKTHLGLSSPWLPTILLAPLIFLCRLQNR